MSRKFISIVVAAAITITAIGAAPARAGDRDETAQVIVGIAALLALGAALSDHDDGVRVHVGTRPRGGAHPRPRGQVTIVNPNRPSVNPRLVLPRHCVRQFSTSQGTRNIVMNRCLRQNFAHYNRLPDRCERIVDRAGRHDRRGFGLRCLRRAGYRLSRR